MLQSAAELVPIPLLKDALGVAIKVIEACEVSSAQAKRVPTHQFIAGRKQRLLKRGFERYNRVLGT